MQIAITLINGVNERYRLAWVNLDRSGGLEDTVVVTIEDLEKLPNWQSTAVDNQTGHSIAIVRADEGRYRLYDGNSMTTSHTNEIRHPEGGNIFSLDEVRQMFATHKLSSLRGFLPD